MSLLLLLVLLPLVGSTMSLLLLHLVARGMVRVLVLLKARGTPRVQDLIGGMMRTWALLHMMMEHLHLFLRILVVLEVEVVFNKALQ